MSTPKIVIVVGTSAGGMNALSEFVVQLKTGTYAAVFIVMHLAKTSMGNFLLHPSTTYPI